VDNTLDLNRAKKHVFFFILFLTAALSGCITERSSVGKTLVDYVNQPAAGSLSDPIIDSNISLAEALRKESPPKFKEKQRLIDLLYYSFDGKIHKGQLVIDERLVKDIREVFRVALENKFPITSVVPISDDRFFKDGKWNEDDQSMMSNNTSAFNYRKVTGGKTLSKHSYGFAIDINPVQNPYIKGNIVLPPNAVYDTAKPGTLTYDSPVVKTFIRLGWTWGGSWKSLKDYQHFEKVLPQ
jgi:peptidoglycan LD-endopeptidase CwlK